MAEYRVTINGTQRSLSAEPEMPLLWALRDLLSLTGTKYGCGVGVCGACTIREGTATVRACRLTVAEATGRSFVTIEGLAAADAGGKDLQSAWIERDVAHCGYCQPAMLLAASALLARGAAVDDQTIREALGDQLCRCGSYPRILRAVQDAVLRTSRK
jgi:aerobic-type carbon monoxide dehydrogenase small subunit (CoxS/CutS family)